MNSVLHESGAALAYGAVGIALMALGYLVVEVTTPGRLGDQIWLERNRGAALILSAKLLGVGAIVATAIVTSDDGLAQGLLETSVYGLIGIALTVVAFYLLDLLTPGNLGATVVESDVLHPACWVVAAADLATAATVAAAIS
ncbi:DUF350 domain-containing protein [Actinomadura atramentaria]|uniref:DUF350 domain-containing protein n=1 Tax=Actinomadura atramentaria TaxID=1990 RepID=UPI00037EFA2E|nr:DUF350 domain-containing protein [Actinomadura atramentaria]